MIAVIDCDNFFVSCEKLFRPNLNGRPAVVLSNNDGCIIARSVEAKALGIPMGAPYFLMKKQLQENGVFVFPANFALYCDLSNRVMAILRNFSSKVEIYSIDESFVCLRHIPDHELENFGEEMRAKILQDVGLAVSVGIAPTKTLAKIATHVIKDEKKQYAKNWYARSGMFPYHHELELCRSGVEVLRKGEALNTMLTNIPVEEIWGIGRKLADRLHRRSITTCSRLIATPPQTIQRLLTIEGLRIQRELQCEVCKEVHTANSLPHSMMYTRSFAQRVTEYQKLEQIITRYAAHLSYKLRKLGLNTSLISIYLTTKHHDPHHYTKYLTTDLPEATNSSRAIIAAAQQLMKQAFLPGFQYRKAGIIATGLVRGDSITATIFDGYNLSDSKIDTVIDAINQDGDNPLVYPGSAGVGKLWPTPPLQRSPCYTTKLSQVLRVT